MTRAYGREGAPNINQSKGEMMRKLFNLAAEFLCTLCGTPFPGHRDSCPYKDLM